MLLPKLLSVVVACLSLVRWADPGAHPAALTPPQQDGEKIKRESSWVETDKEICYRLLA